MTPGFGGRYSIQLSYAPGYGGLVFTLGNANLQAVAKLPRLAARQGGSVRRIEAGNLAGARCLRTR